MLKETIHHFKDFIYPRFCVVCEEPLQHSETELCLPCEAKLPYLPYKFQFKNPVSHLFKNVTPIDGANVCLPFFENSTAQKLIHALKYKGHTELGIILGIKAAEHLKKQNPEYRPDIIQPVPLHFSKERKRGYNQCQFLAIGISQVYGCKISNAIQRTKNTATQTKKGRYDRFTNMADIFEIQNGSDIKNKNVLVIDDVITTGATLNSLCKTVLHAKPKKLHVYPFCYKL